MDPALVSLLVSLASGAVGGNVVGALFKNLSLGTIGNSLAGIVGGGLGGKILAMLLPTLGTLAASKTGGLDLGAIGAQVAGGGVGGGVLMIIVGLVRSMFSK